MDSRFGCIECITPHKYLSNKKTRLKTPKHVKLPKGSVVHVLMTGDMQLNHHFRLTNVLLVLIFWYNLLTISRILQQNPLQVVFSPTTCIFQNQNTEKDIAKTDLHSGLYVLKCI